MHLKLLVCVIIVIFLSLLKPSPFLCYVNDISMSVDCIMLQYADDSAIMVSDTCPGSNFIFRNPARSYTIIIAYCVNNLQCIGYFLLNKK